MVRYYVKQSNYPQAKATLQSIIDKYEGAELVNIAREKYNAILSIEKELIDKKKQDKENKPKEDEIKINLDNSLEIPKDQTF